MKKLFTLAGALLLGLTTVSSESAPAASRIVRVRASTPFHECLGPALDAFSASSGIATSLDRGDPATTQGYDLVVGDDTELTRALEGGDADPRTTVDLGSVPWILVTPEGESAPLGRLSLAADERVLVMSGAVAREAREKAGLPAGRFVLSGEREELRRARYALVPATLAGVGRRQPVDIRPLTAVVAQTTAAPHAPEARRLLEYLGRPEAKALFATCTGVTPAPGERAVAPPRPLAQESLPATTAARYANAAVDFWLPACSLARNGYNNPAETLGSPDAANLGGKDNYRGFMSLGQGGYVVVDMGHSIADRPGADIRVYQTTTGEPVTLYASDSPAGPFVLLGLQRFCGIRSPGLFSNHCDFDLADGPLATARYFKVEDGEIYPCLAGGTLTEGADIDAVEALAP